MIRHPLARRSAGLVTLMSFFTACYSHRPLATAVPAPATRIVAQVTDSGVVAMANAIGPGAVEVEGIVAEADGNAWRLHLLRVEQRSGASTAWNREVVSFPRNALTNARERKLDKGRSWGLAAILAAGALAIGLLLGPAISGQDTPPTPIPPA